MMDIAQSFPAARNSIELEAALSPRIVYDEICAGFGSRKPRALWHYEP
jgi:hypothetical protein